MAYELLERCFAPTPTLLDLARLLVVTPSVELPYSAPAFNLLLLAIAGDMVDGDILC